MTSTSDSVSELPLQLWGKIMEKARPRALEFEACIVAARGCLPKALRVLYANLTYFAALRQVCKGFDQVFRDDPLNFALCVLWNHRLQLAPAELRWLKLHQDQVQHLLLFKTGNRMYSSDTAFQALNSNRSQLKSMMLADPQQVEVSCCAAFTALTSCTLVHTRKPLYDFPCPPGDLTELTLQPLHALPNLTTLVAQGGVFNDLHRLEHLTRLQLRGARVESSTDCRLVQTLGHLHVSHCSWLTGLHRQGLYACERLVHLCIENGFIRPGPTSDVIWPAHSEAEHQISSVLTTLTLLTCLKLSLGSRHGGRELTGLEYVTTLVNLQHLEMGSSKFYFTVPAGISRLTMLSSLKITSSACTKVRLDVDWLPLQRLKKLQFGSGPYIFNDKLLRLADIKALSEVMISFHPGSAGCARCFVSLPDHFTQFAPHVKLCVEGL